MKKITLDYSDWKSIIQDGTGLPIMEQELYDFISKLASRSDVKVILTVDEKPLLLLKFESEKFHEYKIEL